MGNGQLHQVQASEVVGALNCMHDQQILIGGGMELMLFKTTRKVVME